MPPQASATATGPVLLPAAPEFVVGSLGSWEFGEEPWFDNSILWQLHCPICNLEQEPIDCFPQSAIAQDCRLFVRKRFLSHGDFVQISAHLAQPDGNLGREYGKTLLLRQLVTRFGQLLRVKPQ